jgi:hypothetical protein
MSQQSLISHLRGWRGPEADSLDEYLEELQGRRPKPKKVTKRRRK